MKVRDYQDVVDIAYDDLANVFNAYTTKLDGSTSLVYNMNRTLNVIGLADTSNMFFKKYVVEEGDTWTTIAFKTYNNARLWWLVCKMNNIIDPMIQPTSGQELNILEDSYVIDLLNFIKNG
jgi:nucleoid-associated protein YgaU